MALSNLKMTIYDGFMTMTMTPHVILTICQVKSHSQDAACKFACKIYFTFCVFCTIIVLTALSLTIPCVLDNLEVLAEVTLKPRFLTCEFNTHGNVSRTVYICISPFLIFNSIQCKRKQSLYHSFD